MGDVFIFDPSDQEPPKSKYFDVQKELYTGYQLDEATEGPPENLICCPEVFLRSLTTGLAHAMNHYSNETVFYLVELPDAEVTTLRSPRATIVTGKDIAIQSDQQIKVYIKAILLKELDENSNISQYIMGNQEKLSESFGEIRSINKWLRSFNREGLNLAVNVLANLFY